MKKFGWNITENGDKRSPYRYQIKIAKSKYYELESYGKNEKYCLAFSFDIMKKNSDKYFIRFHNLEDALEWAEENAR